MNKILWIVGGITLELATVAAASYLSAYAKQVGRADGKAAVKRRSMEVQA